MANYTDNYNLVKPTMAETADIRTINGNMDTVDQIMHDTQISLADAFDANKPGGYAIRDMVMYEFQLYQCIHPHTGAWDANNWTRANAAETGGNYVEITPTYQSGMKIAETNIDGDTDEIYVPNMGGATSSAAGSGGAVPAPAAGDHEKFLCGNGRWETPSGGGGGGTTVVPNPVGEPTDDLDTVRIGNVIYNIPGSGGGAGGRTIIDTLWSGSETPVSGSPYTATLSHSIQDYDFIVFDGIETNYNQRIKYILNAQNILTNEVYIQNGDGDSGMVITVLGDTSIKLEAYSSAHATTYTSITGLKFTGTLAPLIYSTEEREIGVWVDDKPLYQKTIDFGSDQSFNQGWHNAEEHHDIYDSVISGKLVSTSGLAYSVGVACNDTTYLEFYTENTTSEGRYLTITYTKAADVAGSGKYGSLGIPMVHYSTEEHVVGTYLGETLYQITYPNISITSTNNVIQTGINFGDIVDFEANGYKVDGSNNKIRFGATYNDGGDRLDVEGVNNDVRIICSNWFIGATANVTIRYTKATS